MGYVLGFFLIFWVVALVCFWSSCEIQVRKLMPFHPNPSGAGLRAAFRAATFVTAILAAFIAGAALLTGLWKPF